MKISFLGQFICGDKRCAESEGLRSWEASSNCSDCNFVSIMEPLCNTDPSWPLWRRGHLYIYVFFCRRGGRGVTKSQVKIKYLARAENEDNSGHSSVSGNFRSHKEGRNRRRGLVKFFQVEVVFTMYVNYRGNCCLIFKVDTTFRALCALCCV